MKFRQTFLSFLVSIVIIALAFLLVGFAQKDYGLAPVGLGKLEEKVQSLMDSLAPEQGGIAVGFDQLERTMLRTIRVSGINASYEGKPVLEIESLDFSVGTVGLVRALLGLGVKGFDIEVVNPTLTLDDESLNAVLELAGRFSSSDNPENQEKTEEKSKAPRMDFSVNIGNLCVALDCFGIESSVEGIKVKAGFEDGFSFSGAYLEIPSAEARGYGQEIGVSGLEVSLDKNLEARLSADDVTLSETAHVRDLSGAANIMDGVVNGAFYLASADGHMELGTVGVSGALDALSVQLSYVLESSEAVAVLSADRLHAEAGDLGEAEIGKLSAYATLSSDNLDFSFEVLSLEGSYDGYEAETRNLSADVAYDFSGKNAFAQITLAEAQTKSLGEFTLDHVRLGNLYMNVSYGNEKASGQLGFDIDGNSSVEEVGLFRSSVEIAAYDVDFDDIMASQLEVKLSDTSLECLPGVASASLTYNGPEDMSASISLPFDVSARVSVQGSSIDARLYLNDLKPSDYGFLYGKYIRDIIDFIKEDTALGGSIIARLEIGDGGPGEILSSIPDGRISMNLATRQLYIGQNGISVALSLEAMLDDGIMEVGNLSMATGDYRLSYSGSVDFNVLFPQGRLVLSTISEGKTMGTIGFDLEDDSQAYRFDLVADALGGTRLSGSVNWREKGLFRSSVVLQTVYDSYPMELEVSTSPFLLELSGREMHARAFFGQTNILNFELGLYGLEIHTNETDTITASTDLEGFYDLSEKNFNVYATDLVVAVTDILELGFDLHANQNSVKMSDFMIRYNDGQSQMDGSIDVSFASIQDILAGDTSSLKAKATFMSEESDSHLTGAFSEDSYYVDLKWDTGFDAELGILGNMKDGFYASGSISRQMEKGSSLGIGFDSSFSDGVLSFFNLKGNIMSAALDDAGLEVNFSDRTLSGYFTILNNVSHMSGPVSQGGTFTIDAKLDSLKESALSLAGLDAQAVFTLGIKDAFLDSFRIADTSVTITYERTLVTAEGELINGLFDFTDRYFELSIEPDFLFGLKARGMIADGEIDVELKDLCLPVTLLNQFIDFPAFEAYDGTVEGDLLVTGDIRNPELYGMLFCSSLDLGLFWVPDQVLSIKSLVITAKDRTVNITDAPFLGYGKNDGRIFNGTLNAEVDFSQLKLQSIDLNVDVAEPLEFWLPLRLGLEEDAMVVNVRGDVVGGLNFWVRNSDVGIVADVVGSEFVVDFELDPVPDWFYQMHGGINLDINLTTGKDFEVYYPSERNAFLNFTLTEGESMHMNLNKNTGAITSVGSYSIKTGQIFYFQNDFHITNGRVTLAEPVLDKSKGMDISLDLTAKLKDYDTNGNKIEISLILQNATLDNISPRLESTPAKSENEILQLLGETFLPTTTGSALTFSGVASFAAKAANALTRLGILESNMNYSLTGAIRNALGLDFFTARSAILQNIIIQALPGSASESKNISLLARYLDGTSIFAGKYIGSTDFFAQISFLLKADRSRGRYNTGGHFLSDDLILDTEFSVDWDNPMGSFSIFTKPQELSVLSFLDTIGFSVTKSFQF